MQKVKAILVDDELNSRIVLRSLLRKHSDKIEIADEAKTVAEAYQLISKHAPQLVFLDIQMPMEDGFSLLAKYDTLPFEVIFVTSFDKYAINAIKFSALDYLLKPVETSDLEAAVNRAYLRINEKKNNQPQIINLLHNLNNETNEHKIAVHQADNVKLLEEKNITHIEADGSYCHIYTADGGSYITSKYLKDFEDYFGENSLFVRVNKSILLNTKYISSYSKGEPCIIKMVNEETFEVSRRKKQEVLEKLKK